MNQLPLWPPLAAIAFGLIGYVILRYMSHRLDREEEEARRRRSPAE
jgi:hypothetical protein